MADMIHQGPHTNEPTGEDRRGQGPNADFSQLSVAAHFSEAETPRLPTHTSASVTQRWSRRSFDSGVVIEGRVVGGAR
jgi:hypothetical protein